MKQYIRTIVNALQCWTQEKIKKSKSDWNQNNSSADDYIKNRPFYEENGKVYKIDEKYLPDNIITTKQFKQANWEQNDESAYDFIKNRTHYCEIGPVGDLTVTVAK